jgi:hypothetical protein
MLDAAVRIAKSEGSDITTVFRTALAEFVRTKALPEGEKIDRFLENSKTEDQIYSRILTPADLRNWSDSGLVRTSKCIKSRMQELDSELRRRGFYFKW